MGGGSGAERMKAMYHGLMTSADASYAPVLPDDTVGLFCERHGMDRDTFFGLNPGVAWFYTEQGVRTAQLDEGQVLAVQQGPASALSSAAALQARALQCADVLGGVYNPATDQCCPPSTIQSGSCATDLFKDRADQVLGAKEKQTASNHLIEALAAIGLLGVGAYLWVNRRAAL